MTDDIKTIREALEIIDDAYRYKCYPDNEGSAPRKSNDFDYAKGTGMILAALDHIEALDQEAWATKVVITSENAELRVRVKKAESAAESSKRESIYWSAMTQVEPQEGARSLGFLVQKWAEDNKILIGPHTAASLADALHAAAYHRHIDAAPPAAAQDARELEGEWDRLTKKEMWDTIQGIRTHVHSDGTESIISDIDAMIEDSFLEGERSASLAAQPHGDAEGLTRADKYLAEAERAAAHNGGYISASNLLHLVKAARAALDEWGKA